MKLSLLNEATWYNITGGYNPTKGEKEPIDIIEAPDEWWHGTTDTWLPHMLEHGLRGLFLTKNRTLAVGSAKRAAYRYGGAPIIITAHLNGLDDVIIKGTKTDSNMVQGIIPKSHFEYKKLSSKTLFKPHPGNEVDVSENGIQDRVNRVSAGFNREPEDEFRKRKYTYVDHDTEMSQIKGRRE